MNDYFDPIFDNLLCAFRKKCNCQSPPIKDIDDGKVSLDLNQMVGIVFSLRLLTAYPTVGSLPSSMHMV